MASSLCISRFAQARHLPLLRKISCRSSGSSSRSSGSSSSSSSGSMEVEVKLTLGGAAAHQKVLELLAPYHKITHHQENFFFDGTGRELQARRAVLRFRFYNGDSRCVVSLKGNAVLVDGISRVEEEEEDLDVSIGRACVMDPSKVIAAAQNCGILSKVVRLFNCTGFICLGGFKNTRNVFDWEGEKLEVDHTEYSFGACYEMECETPDPERVKSMLQAFLEENGIPHSHSVANKFGIFISGKLPSTTI